MMRTLTKRLGLLVIALLAATACAQSYSFDLDPQQSRVEFTLDDVLHTVHGTFQLKSGSMHFDGTTGAASGLLVVETASGDSGGKARDRKMHADILESPRFPEITFAPQHITGQVLAEGRSQVTVDGLMTLHGQSHPMSLPAALEVHSGQVIADFNFQVPYVQWGLKNPSTFILRVSDKVAINVHAAGRLSAAAAAPAN